jgi:phenylpyruvate tautomerase PptA (4-oxalocrotonate tautomerase family)
MAGAFSCEVSNSSTSAIVEATGSSDGVQVKGVLVVIDEVVEGNWGAGGKTISLNNIAEAVGQPKDGPRLTWIRS